MSPILAIINRKDQSRGRTSLGRYICYFIVINLLTCSSLRSDEFFEKHVRPLLVAKCYQCHAGTKTSGGLSLDTKDGWSRGGESGPAIVPGDLENSLLINAINYRGIEMPPPEKGGKLKPDEIDILTQWVSKRSHRSKNRQTSTRRNVKAGGQNMVVLSTNKGD